MNAKWNNRYGVLVVALAIIFFLGGCRPAGAPSDDIAPEVGTPAQTPAKVTEAFYNWYFATIGDRDAGESNNPLVDRTYRESPYLTEEFIAKVDRILDSFGEQGGGYDPFLQAQDVPTSFTVEPYGEREEEAHVIVHEYWQATPPHDLNVDLVKEDGAWKIDNIMLGNRSTPQGVTRLFYDWYIGYARNEGNPLVDDAYKESEFLSEAFIAQVEETLAGFENGGYDPILMAQDIPESIFVEEPDLDGDMATVVVQRYWGGNPDPSPMTVHLEQIDGQWQIVDVTVPEPEATEPEAALDPAGTVDAFYAWYLDYIGEPGSETFRNPIVDEAYRDAPYLTEEYVQRLDDLLAAQREEFGGVMADPILCAQDIPTEVHAEGVCMNGDMASVVVGSSFPNQIVTVDVKPVNGGWQIGNITCANSPEGSVKAFYTWYLAYIGERGTGEMRNPLADGAYKESVLLTDAFIARVDEIVASFEQGGYDPFLLAQDMPTAFSVDPGTEPHTVIVHEQFGPDSIKHLKVTTVPEGSRFPIDDVAEAEAPGTTAPTDAGADTSDWYTYVDEELGFSFKFPAGWVIEQLDLDGPGIPADWPVVQSIQLMPPDVAEQISQSTGPDPNASPIVAPFNVEVTVGSDRAFSRVYPPPADAHPETIAGYNVAVRWNDPGYVQYVFAHPDGEMWVVFTDYVTEFPGREEQAEAVQGILRTILETFTFAG